MHAFIESIADACITYAYPSVTPDAMAAPARATAETIKDVPPDGSAKISPATLTPRQVPVISPTRAANSSLL